MRAKAVFCVFPRKMPGGKAVYYYQCYDNDGRRLNGHSTGQITRTAAVAYCMKLYREGNLVPKKKVPTFEEYAKGWWDFETCGYLRWRTMRKEITVSTAALFKSNTDLHITPYFGKMKLDAITEGDIEAWLSTFKGKSLKNTTANSNLHTFKIMMGEAVRRGILAGNPAARVQDLPKEQAGIDILKLEEVRKLFNRDSGEVWGSRCVCIANKLAAFTGMRIGEVLGLRGEHVFDDYITVCGQYTRYGFLKTKNKESREIPITALLREELQELISVNGAGYVFSEDGGDRPVARSMIYREFYRALGRIKISDTERKKRNLSFHGWRHFFNTTLRMANVADSKLQRITGHKSIKMTEHYTHFSGREFTEVREVQDNLLAEPEGKPGTKPVEPETAVKKPKVKETV
jgi:integrase